ncbi:Surface antigen [Nannocystis exedens]|uniref:Surface antigen n=1 Tax=Nannocystis exedens TaxID=54 RepID=A0A1I1ZKG9_9BACT|nr:BamA/TamA family outer membrane protein [Nannocystis exedens]PCC75450.1 membrane protein [Nannocystis exedens]SFE32206.1 Surface antigen [Nannocystis exedens]
MVTPLATAFFVVTCFAARASGHPSAWVQEPVLKDSELEPPTGPLKSDAAAGGAPEPAAIPAAALPAGAVPEGARPEGGKAPTGRAPTLPPRERVRWSWLTHPLSPTPSQFQVRKGKSPHRVLPLPSVRSQPGIGLMLGANISYAYRRKEGDPNRIYMIFESRVSLKKVQDHSFFIRLRDLLRREEVFELAVLGYVDPVFPYFGIGNNNNLEGIDLQARYYQTHLNTVGGSLTYQHPLWLLPARGDRPAGLLRSYAGLAYYADRVKPYDNSLLSAEHPAADLNARRGLIRLGLTWDRRDNEWSPGKGSLFDVIVDNAGPWTGSTDAWGRFSANFRTYWTLGVDKLVLAHRLSFDALWGDPPLVPLGEFGGLLPTDGLGGAAAGRGWMRRRYIGRLKAFGSLELRFEPLELKVRRHTLGIGLKGFVDLGVVAGRMQDLPKHWHVSGGTGLQVIWDRFAVLRLDAGFSRESFGIYFINEHAF